MELAPPVGRAPDLIDPIVGFRQWRLVEGALTSLYSGLPWAVEAQAECRLGVHDRTSTPAKSCTCGIYAYYAPCPRTASVAPNLVSGVVVLWGLMELHATGMRAGNAQIVALEQPLGHGRKRAQLLELAEQLEIPVVPHRKLKTVAMDHGLPLPPSLRPSRSWSIRDPNTGNVGQQPDGVVPGASLSAIRTARNWLWGNARQ
jgi:hypothetical protein